MNQYQKAGLSRRAALLLLLALVLPASAQGPFLSRLSTTITNGQSLSAVIDTKDQPILAVLMPAAWDTAQITLQGSVDGTNFFDVYNMSGDEFTIQAAASRIIVLSPFEFQWARYIKLRSGTSGSPVNQTSTRTIVIMTRKVL